MQQHQSDLSGNQSLQDPLEPLPLIRCCFGRYFEE